MKYSGIPILWLLSAVSSVAQRPGGEVSAQAVARYPELGKSGSPFNREFLRRAKIYGAENPLFTNDKAWVLKLADEVAKVVDSYAPAPEIEFKVLLIIKRYSDTVHPLFLPVRAEMTEVDIATARHCFEIQTPDMVHEATQGRVQFTPTVVVSDLPLRSLNPKRRDSAEYSADELQNEFAGLAKPGDFDAVGYYFLYFDNTSGYKIPRAGYGVGGFNGKLGTGSFAVGSASKMNPRDEIFLHEWMHGLDGYYGGKPGVRLAKGALHGSGNYDAHYGQAKLWRPGDSFRGYMDWYKDLLNGEVPDANGGFVGLGGSAWKHGPMREEAKKLGGAYTRTPVASVEYPGWVYELMKGDLRNARLGPSLAPVGSEGSITKESRPWRLESWSGNGKTTARFTEADGGTFTLDCPTGNHASIRCEVSLDPFANYVFTAEVKSEGVKIEQDGGHYSALIGAESSQSTRDFSGAVDWTPMVLPFTTKGDEAKGGQSAATLRLQLGGPSSIATGRVSFRKLRLQKVAYPE